MTTGKYSIISPGNLWLHVHKRILSLNLIRCKSRSNAKRLHPNLLRLIGIALPWVSPDTYVSDSIHDPNDWLTDPRRKTLQPEHNPGTSPRLTNTSVILVSCRKEKYAADQPQLLIICQRSWGLIMQLYVDMNDWFRMFHDDLLPCYPLWCLFVYVLQHMTSSLSGLIQSGLSWDIHHIPYTWVRYCIFMVPDDLWVRSFMTDYYTCISISAALG
jgi:hypothetical protein